MPCKTRCSCAVEVQVKFTNDNTFRLMRIWQRDTFHQNIGLYIEVTWLWADLKPRGKYLQCKIEKRRGKDDSTHDIYCSARPVCTPVTEYNFIERRILRYWEGRSCADQGVFNWYVGGMFQPISLWVLCNFNLLFTCAPPIKIMHCIWPHVT